MFSDLNTKLKQLYDESDHRKSLDIAIESANEVLKVLSPSVSGLAYGEDALDNAVSASKFPNHKIESWFTPHPYFADDRVALKLYDSDNVEVHFYWLSDSATKARIAAGTAITSNWEDSELNQKDDSYKVGLDFFLSHDTNSLLVVVTSKNNLRVLELEGRLSNTQADIFKSIKGAFDLPAKSQIHQTIWDALALSEVNKKFYAGVAEHFTILINHLISEGYDKEDSKLFTSRLLGRLLFVWFLRKKHIIDESFGYFDIESKSSTDYYDDSLKQLFFHTLNTPINDSSRKDKVTPYLNGGLFEAHDNDWADRKVTFPTGYFKSLYRHLEQYNFTTDESSPEYEQVAIDPEMLGRVFESLLATQSTETGDQARKAKGAFYTPREVVSYMSRESLRQYLYNKLDNPAWNEGIDKLLDIPDAEWELSHSNSKRNLWGEANRNIVPAAVITALDDLKVLDPACGSGAFPMGMLQIILKTYERLESRFDPYTTKLRIIEENIYGVDIEPMAVEISRLRAWLSIVVDSNKNPSDFKPLPNLDFKFVVANSLIPLSKDFQLGDDKFDKVRSKMQWVIGKYFNTTDKQEKAKLRQEFSKQASQLTQTSLLDQETELQRQLNSFRPFNVHSEATLFDAKLMFGLKSKSPFDLVIGNPPYVSTEKIKEPEKSKYQVEYSDIHKSRTDIYTYFYKRGLDLVTENGFLCYITSNKWMRAGYGEKIRKFFASKNPIKLIDFGGFKVFESATVDTNILLIQNSTNKNNLQAAHFKNDFKRDDDVASYFAASKVTLSGLSSSAWFIGSRAEMSLKEKIDKAGTPLKDWDIKISRGVITGFNEAFIIDEATKERLIAEDPNSFDIIKPLLRGRDIKRYGYEFADYYVLTVGFGDYKALELKYPAVHRHLLQYEEKLKDRGQCKSSRTGKQISADFTGQHHWLELDNNPSQEYFNQFEQPKIVWKRIGSVIKFTYDINNYFGLDSTCIMTGSDLRVVIAVINSQLGYHMLQDSPRTGTGDLLLSVQAINPIKIPKITLKNQHTTNQLSTLVTKIQSVTDESEKSELSKQIDKLVYQLYDLNPEEIKMIEDLASSK